MVKILPDAFLKKNQSQNQYMYVISKQIITFFSVLFMLTFDEIDI